MDDYNSTISPSHPFDWEEKGRATKEQADIRYAAQQNEQEGEVREEDFPNWDGSEAQYVEDADAAEYEERYAGIQITYQLTREEVEECLKHAGIYQKAKARAVVETVLCAVLCVFFAAECILSWDPFQLFLSILSGGLIAALWWGYYARIRQHAAESGNAETTVCFYPDEVEIGGKNGWSIPLDGTCTLEEYNGMLLLYPKSDKIVAIPIRSIEPSVLADVQAMLVAGTTPFQEEDYS